ncbi:MAG: DUF2085 domain-containing protein [Cystobacterineae bacterium]|nr:DUF2085 domain-containing protein [Cystobacterineae bacterium]
MWSRFLFSHHREDELHRCYAVRGRFFCARCVGLYPVLLLAWVLQFVFHVSSQEMLVERWMVLGLSLPAMVDWVWGQFWPKAFSNGWRTLTGGLLGLALGRMLYIHMKEPFPVGLCWQLLAGLFVVLLVVLLKWRRAIRSSQGSSEEG